MPRATTPVRKESSVSSTIMSKNTLYSLIALFVFLTLVFGSITVGYSIEAFNNNINLINGENQDSTSPSRDDYDIAKLYNAFHLLSQLTFAISILLILASYPILKL